MIGPFIYNTLWACCLGLAIFGIVAHARLAWQFTRALTSGEFNPISRSIIQSWAADEVYRAILHAWLGLIPLGYLGVRVSFWIGRPPGDIVLAIFFQFLGLLGIGGTIIWLTIWRFQIEHRRHTKTPSLRKRAG